MSYILLSPYSFPDWLSEEAEADGARQAVSVDESNDELDSLHTVTVKMNMFFFPNTYELF